MGAHCGALSSAAYVQTAFCVAPAQRKVKGMGAEKIMSFLSPSHFLNLNNLKFWKADEGK